MRIIPSNRDAVLQLAAHAEAGAQSLESIVGLAQNTSARIAADRHDLVGVPGSSTNTGNQGRYNQKCGDLVAARAARREVIEAGRKLCSSAVDMLKAHLGRTWNVRWIAAGFSRFSIATSKAKVVPVLLELRNYFRDNPNREVASEGITSTACDAALTAIQVAEYARNAAKSAFQDARDDRDESVARLARRLSGLRYELDGLLANNDSRWLEFGFSRPIDGSMPTAVTGVTVKPGLQGKLHIQWDASVRAINYRVSWRLHTSEADTVKAGLFADRAANLSELPSGATIIVQVTARNNSGETQPAEVTAVVP